MTRRFLGQSRRTALLVGAGAAVLATVLAIVLSVLGPGAGQPIRNGDARPILLITSAADPFSRYYGEILRTEGFSSVTTTELTDLTDATLRNASILILPALELTAAQGELISGWVSTGGDLVAVRPDAQLAETAGLTRRPGGVQDNGYVGIDTSAPPGLGITSETLQFHGSADLYDIGDNTRVVATIYSDATTPTPFPAVTLRELPDASGRVVTFAYDLARSVVMSRQGNPSWAGQERDGIAPIRPNELFEGAGGRDFVDMSKIAVPQADEQQRLLANILIDLADDQDLQVRSWYFPKGAKAVLVLAADDHTPGDRAREALAYQESQSPPSCSVEDWECIRSTSLMYTNGDLTDAELAGYREKGFDFGVHVNTGCRDWTKESLTKTYTDELAAFRDAYPSQPAQVANRIHCVAWSDYVSAAKIGQEFGLRLDLDYYYWPGKWVQNRPGFFTGSGIPMRFADLDGTVINVYQAPSHLVNESGMRYPAAVETQLDRALGALGYYGAFGTHYDYTDTFDRQLIAVGKEKGVPMVTAAQLLSWLDARAATSFTPVSWNGPSAAFRAVVPPEARGLMRGMIPLNTKRGTVTTITKDGQDVPFIIETIKGVRYAMFTATSGEFTATFAADSQAPSLVSTIPGSGEAFSATAGIVATFDEPLNCATVTTASVQLIGPSGTAAEARVACEADSAAIRVTPFVKPKPGERYRLTLDQTITDLVGNSAQAVPELSFPAGDGSVSLWAHTAPSDVAIADDDLESVELGVRFSAQVKGRVTGIWFFKGADQVDRHTVTLWASDGSRLATTRTNKETTTGWQFAKFTTAVDLKVGRTYIASFRSPHGQYAYLRNGLAAGTTQAPLVTPSDGGIYRYGNGVPNKMSPDNYLIDVAFLPD